MFVTNLNFQANWSSINLSYFLYRLKKNLKEYKGISIMFIAILDNLFAYVLLFKSLHFLNIIIFCPFSTNKQKNI